MARSGRAGNPDGTPRLELAEGGADDDAIIAAIQAAEAEEKAATGSGAKEDGAFPFQEETRGPTSEFPSLVTDQAPSVDTPRPTYYDKKRQAAQAKETAAWLVMILEGAAIMSFGEPARILPNEKRMITEPLQRIMARMDPALNEALQKWTDPILLIFGLGTWGMRLYAMARDDEEDDSGPRRKPPSDVPPAGDNGRKAGRTLEEVLGPDEDNAILRAGPDERITSLVGDAGRTLS